ncbi:MAG: trigger factor [Geminicoccaceae bacterium]
MQVTEVSAQGLRREYRVVVPAGEIEDRITKRLDELRQRVRMPGFRPGKVPVSLLRKQYGRSVLGEVVEQAVNQGSQKAISDHALRPALRPKVEVNSFDEGTDLEFTMAIEVLPEVPQVDLKAIELTRPVAEVTDQAVAEALARFAKRFDEYQAPAEPRRGQDGDRLIIDFKGEVDGAPFEGGSAEGFGLVLGSGMMVPGFEEQLIGVEVGDERAVEVTFPGDFPNEGLAGKQAKFAVEVKEVQERKPAELNDDLAKGQGFEGLEALKKTMRESLERHHSAASRAKLKRSLLDHLAEHCKFDVPAGMVELEFDAIWKQVGEEMAHAGAGEAPDKSEEALKEEYRQIAERRVRLGLILSDLGQRNDLKVEPHELNAAIMQQAQRYPGQERQVAEYFRKSPQAVEQLRAPLYEDKVVDFILQMASVGDQPVSVEELMREPDEENGHHHDHDHDHDQHHHGTEAEAALEPGAKA